MRQQLPTKIGLFLRVLARIDHSSLRERIVVLSGDLQFQAMGFFLGRAFISINKMKQSLPLKPFPCTAQEALHS